jgi:hypothetical protein
VRKAGTVRVRDDLPLQALGEVGSRVCRVDAHGQGLIEGRIRCLLWRPTFPPRQDPRTADGSWVKGKEIPVDVLILASTSTCLRIVSQRFPGKPSLTAFLQDPRPLRPGSAALELTPPFQA